jgi:hypothetical protein
MVGAKQLRTLGLSWFRPGPYVQQGRARGTILLCTRVPVVGRLQARRERRRGLQVPRGVIEASANIVGEAESVWTIAIHCPVSDVSCPWGEGDHLPFIGQGEGDLQACRTISLRVMVWRTVPGSWRSSWRILPQSWRRGVPCAWTGAASRVEAWWLTGASPGGLEGAVDDDPYEVE